jgi:hypothetical protein
MNLSFARLSSPAFHSRVFLLSLAIPLDRYPVIVRDLVPVTRITILSAMYHLLHFSCIADYSFYAVV